MNHFYKFTFLIISTLLWTSCASHRPAPSPQVNINFSEILQIAQRAKAAYDTPAQIKKAYPNTIRIAQIKSTDVQYFLEFNPTTQTQIISIRGTANLSNAKQDAEYIAFKDSSLGIYVHKGFSKDTQKLYKDIIPFLKKGYPIFLTGHSLGAAIANLLMMRLADDNFSIQKAVTFGQPKVTNKAGVLRYNSLPLTRIVNENDLVSMVPPITVISSLHGVYEHMGAEITLLNGKYFTYSAQTQASEHSVGEFWKNITSISLEEHYMKNYIKNISSKTNRSYQVPYQEKGKYSQ